MCGRLGWIVFLCPDASCLGASESVTRCECEADERSWDHWKFRGHSGWQVDPFKEAPRIGFQLELGQVYSIEGNRLHFRMTLIDIEVILPKLEAGSQWLSARKIFFPKDRDSWRKRPKIGRMKLGEFVWVAKDVLNFSLLKEGSNWDFYCRALVRLGWMIFCTYEMTTLRKWRPKLPLWCKHWVIQPNLRREILKPLLRRTKNHASLRRWGHYGCPWVNCLVRGSCQRLAGCSSDALFQRLESREHSRKTFDLLTIG